jgi:hypothetical protein
MLFLILIINEAANLSIIVFRSTKFEKKEKKGDEKVKIWAYEKSWQ